MKYRVLIVEDDQNFRYAIRNVIPWDENGYEIVGEAIHGKQALSFLEKIKADVLLTDMDMPIMNGVELTRTVKERYPDMVIVALSAYDDFAFVKESMRLGAADYILKQTMNEKNIIEVLDRTLREQTIRNKEEKAQDKKEELRRYLRGELAEEEMKSLSNDFPELSNTQMIFFLLYTEDTVDWKSWDEEDGKLLWAVSMGKGEWAVLFEIPRMNRQSVFQQHVSSIQNVLRKNLKGRKFLVNSSVPGTLYNLQESYRQSKRAMEYKPYFIQKEKLEDGEADRYERMRKPAYMYVLSEETKIRTPEDMNVLLEDLEKKLYQYLPEESFLNKNFVQIYKEFSQRVLWWDKGLHTLQYYEEIQKRISVKEKIEYTKQLIRQEWEKNVVSYKGGNTEILRAITYIHHHYQEELSLKQLAEYVGLSENYFSNLFKQELGQNLTMFVNEVRIARAKELMRQENKKNYEIAKKVGYQNTTYFSTMFKKITGMSITEYKKKMDF